MVRKIQYRRKRIDSGEHIDGYVFTKHNLTEHNQSANKTLYYIENCGCDDYTQGLIRLTDKEFKRFETFVKNLNKNSTYGCMPKIQVYKINDSQIIECTYKDDTYYDINNESLGKGELMYLDDKVYIIDKVAKWDIINKRQVI